MKDVPVATVHSSRSVVTPGGTESSDRVADVLLLFGHASGPLGVTEIARTLGLNKTVVHRILQSLTSRSLTQNALHSSSYVLGPAAIGLGSRALGQVDVRRLAAPILRKLRDDTNETSTLSVLAGHSRIYVDQYESPQEVKMVVDIGPRLPLHSGASSRSILAFLGAQFVAEAVEQLASEAPEFDEKAYRDRLETVRAEGYAVSLNERNTGAASIAAPFFDSAGNVIGSISSSGPVARYAQTQSEHIQQVVDAAAAITALLGA
ncbi:hypothetical protein AX769_19540 [Frondihabitans sp. PAMC 28766]|uniref:IclR family transcriptional regulator n=1 Tax=Frondihabitans sp. PAMC 28766 TaxID=1795630 RepID=UPI00078CC55D|nr:IclR family transcriptional regulator [Frondihabitans sp. PAMC 28766]AMM21935.1 hypothetical protein AX769_19540 [Frondihabitans sp. PAMC 28766]